MTGPVNDNDTAGGPENDTAPTSFDVRHVQPYRISPGDSVRLAVLHRPTGRHDVTVVLEVWDVGGAQPPNSHPRSVETFFFLAGTGTAYCDGHVSTVAAGQLLVLPPRSTHRIVNDGPSRLYAITTMTPDDGFAALIEAGEPTSFDPGDLTVFGVPTSGAAGSGGTSFDRRAR